MPKSSDSNNNNSCLNTPNSFRQLKRASANHEFAELLEAVDRVEVSDFRIYHRILETTKIQIQKEPTEV